MFDANLILFIVGCIIAGCFAGLSSGLLGLGGGLVIVPILNYLIPLTYHSIDPAYVLPVAIQTSFGVIIFNTLSAAIKQYKQDNLDKTSVIYMGPSLIVGSAFVGLFVTGVNPGYLKVLFSLIVIYLAYKMIISGKKKEHDLKDINIPPLRSVIVGLIIGGLSSSAGIGGGGFLSPYFNQVCKLPIKRSLATATACSFFVGISGFISYFYSGITHHVDTKIPFTYGYLNLISLFSFLITSVYFANYGVKLQTRLPAPKIKKIFAIFLIIIALDMAYSGLHYLHYV